MQLIPNTPRATSTLLLWMGFVLGGCGSATDGFEDRPPEVVLSVGLEERFTTDQVIQIQVNATDPEGGLIDLEYDYLPSSRDGAPDWSIADNASFNDSGGWGVFSWDPAPGDVTRPGEDLRLIFRATDQGGVTTERVVHLTIEPGNGAPTLSSPSSTVYANCCDTPLRYDLVVRDDNSARVNLSLQPGAPTANFMQTGDKSGVFTWLPSPSERVSQFHTFTFVADDGGPTPTTFDLRVTLLANTDGVITSAVTDEEEGGDDPERSTAFCPLLSPDVIVADLQPIYTGAEDYLITAHLNEDALAQTARFDEFMLFYTRDDPFGDNPNFQTVEMLRDADDQLRAVIPNANSDRQVTYSYTMCAIDTDPMPDQESIVCNPRLSSVYLSFLALGPGQQSCSDESLGNDSAASADVVPVNRGFVANGFTHRRICEEQPDYIRLSVPPKHRLQFYVIPAKPDEMKLNLTYGDGKSLSLVDRLLTRRPMFCGFGHRFYLTNSSGSPREYLLAIGGSDQPYYTYLTDEDLSCSGDDDPNEPNNSSSTFTEFWDATFENLSLCKSSDDDWYRIETREMGELSASFQITDASINADPRVALRLYETDGAGKANKEPLHEVISDAEGRATLQTMLAGPDREYYLVVDPISLLERALDYDLSLDVSGARTCEMDECEELGRCVLKPGNVLERCQLGEDGCLAWEQVATCN